MEDEFVQRHRWNIVWVLSLALFLVILDNSITNVALPSLARDMNASFSDLQWIVDSYALVFAALLLPFGTLADRIGRKRTLLAGLLMFGFWSVVAVFAQNPMQLIIFRAAQGVGAAMVFPTTLAILISVFTDPVERAKAIGVWSTTAGLAIAMGPVIGGGLLEHFWWGSTFLVNVPVVVFAVVLGNRLLPESKSLDTGRLDIVGLLVSVAFIAIIVFTIIEAPKHGWLSITTVGGMAVGSALIVAFVKWERQQDHPLLDVEVFRNPRFTAATLAIAAGFFTLLGAVFLITQYLQVVRGYSTFSAGLHTLPFALGAGAAGPVATQMSLRLGTKVTVTIGLLMMALGYLWMSQADASTAYWGPVVGSMLLVAAGLTITTAPATEAVMGALPADKAGVSSAINDTARELGGTLGVAVMGSAFSSVYSPRLGSQLENFGYPFTKDVLKMAKESVIAAVTIANEAPLMPPAMRADMISKAQSAFLNGLSTGLLVATVVSVLGAVTAAVYLPSRATEQSEEEELVMAERPDPWDEFFEGEHAERQSRRSMADPYGLPDDDMVGAGAGRGGYDPRDRDWEDELVAARPERPAVTYEYAILSLEPREFDRVTLPDRTVQDVRRNHGMSVLESWFDMHVRSETDFQAAAAQQAWQARYAAWRSRVLVTRGRGPGNPRAGMPTGPVDVIRMPNGSVHSAPLGEADRLLLAHYTDTVEREPRVSAVSFDDWLHTANVQIDTGRGWQATLQTDERSEPLGYAVGSDGSGPPVREIALSALNHLGREGWELMSVDDDRNSVMGDLNGRPAPVRTINYLLKRANQASFAPLTPDLASADLRL